MFSYPDQLSSATKTQLETQLSLLTALSGKAFESMERMMELNIATAKAVLEESGINFQQLLAAKDAQELIALSANQVQPNAEKFVAYGRQLAGIATSAQAEFVKTAEEQISETNRKAVELMDEVSKSAPPGSENVIAMMRSAIGNTNAGYEQLSKTVKQAAEAFEANMNLASAQFAQSSAKTNSRASGSRKQA
ncbi:TIGR01841 family phasin [Oxalobacteraceae bacterium R-40]|uniref:TIGR01841 family phasin n=1 Tax=Keguizhuia sedimenti TaxID=3064264 RepID=A0ABU1BRH7_9BURK|nr:TIGR01841 family phasin [Oxalobacteraceae bacterium R-40]